MKFRSLILNAKRVSAEVCATLQAFAVLGSTNKLPLLVSLLLSDSCSVLSSIFPFILNFLGKNCLLSPPVLSGYIGSPDTHFSRETTRLMSWPDGERDPSPLQSLVVSLLLPLVSTLLFSRTGGALSHQNSLTHKFPRFPPKNLCALSSRSVFSPVFAATNTGFYLALISLGLAKSRIFSEAPADTRPSTPLISFCTVSYGLFGKSLSLYDLWSRPCFWALWSSAMPPSVARGRVTRERLAFSIKERNLVSKLALNVRRKVLFWL